MPQTSLPMLFDSAKNGPSTSIWVGVRLHRPELGVDVVAAVDDRREQVVGGDERRERAVGVHALEGRRVAGLAQPAQALAHPRSPTCRPSRSSRCPRARRGRAGTTARRRAARRTSRPGAPGCGRGGRSRRTGRRSPAPAARTSRITSTSRSAASVRSARQNVSSLTSSPATAWPSSCQAMPRVAVAALAAEEAVVGDPELLHRVCQLGDRGAGRGRPPGRRRGARGRAPAPPPPRRGCRSPA